MKSEEFIKFSDPIKLFTLWIEEAKKKEINDYNACCLATSDAAGIPSARMVLMKKYDERGFIFYTNLESRKAREFERNVRISWQGLQNETDYCDITLACEDKQIKAHKLIISACSSVIRNILKQNQNPHPLIYLRRVKYKDLQNLLTFMYQGVVNVAEEDLSSFLEVAEDLNIRGLS